MLITIKLEKKTLRISGLVGKVFTDERETGVQSQVDS